MGNVAKSFFIALFDAVLIYMMVINFGGWSGALQSIGQSGNSGWSEGSYFGFESLLIMFSQLNNLDSYTKMFTENLSNFGNWALGNLPSLVNDVMDAFQYSLSLFGKNVTGWDVLRAVLLIAQCVASTFLVFVAPAVALWYAILCFIPVIMFSVDVIAVFLLAIGGQFNVTADMYTFSDYLSELSSIASSGALILSAN